MRHICTVIALICANALSATIYYNDDGSPDYDKINEDMQKQSPGCNNAENDLPIDYTQA
jgi:hypothetical protein